MASKQPAVLNSLPTQHTAFMSLTLLSEVNSACHLARKMLGTAASSSNSGGAGAGAAAAALAAVDRVTFAAFRWGRWGAGHGWSDALAGGCGW